MIPSGVEYRIPFEAPHNWKKFRAWLKSRHYRRMTEVSEE